MNVSTQEIGKLGEAVAATWLEEHGYEIITTNYFARVGEIDIIARYIADNRLSFIEVKTRKKRTGEAEFAHSNTKHTKIKKAAQMYCKEQNIDVDVTLISFEHLSVYTDETEYDVEQYIVNTIDK